MRRERGLGLRGYAVVLLAALPILAACSGSGVRSSVGEAVDPEGARQSGSLLARFTVVQVVGAPGAVTPSQIAGTHLQVPCGGYACFQPGIMTDGPVVGRSPATAGVQQVLLGTNIYDRSGGGYATIQIQDVQQLTIPAGTPTAQFAHDQWLPNTGGSKSATFYVVWGDEQGQALGWQVIAMNQRSDYACVTSFTLACTVGDGFVTVTEPGP